MGAGAVTTIRSLMAAAPPLFRATIHVVDERPSKLHTVVAVFVHKGTGEPDISPELVFIDMLKANGMPFAADSRCAFTHF